MIDGAPQAKRPDAAWTDRGDFVDGGHAWQHYRGTRVISSLQMAELPDGSGIGPQWHVSVSNRGQRPSPRDVERALRAFGMVGAEEDNHHPGNARHFWIPVDPAHRVDCECKVDEENIVDADGYRWTNPKVGEGECRGCEIAALRVLLEILDPETKP